MTWDDFGDDYFSEQPAEDDTDGDGLPNYAEFVLGTNPTDPTSRFTLSLT